MSQINFEALLEANKDRIFRICSIYALSPIEPEDLFQEVVFQIWKSLGSFKGNSHINTWVYRIAINVCISSKLKLERVTAKTVRFDAIQYKTAQETTNSDDEDLKYQLLRECIAALTESDTSIVVLYLEELSYQQISEVTGLTENHVAVKMKRIRKKLLDCMKPKLV